MATSPMSEAIEHFRRTVLLRDGAGLTDGQLLGCFIEQRDEAAFATLVRRHGPMVWGVCRRLLSDADAEDAFQATFLVLVRKAASVVPREMIGSWLYGVAHQTALQARRTAARRRARERQVTEMPEPAVVEQDLWRDLQPLLDQELRRLPDKYRAVIVLCDLEGRTRKEAARQLGVPEGTVASRMATARRMLANRLTKRGIALSGGTLATVLAEQAASAGVPTAVVSSTIKAAAVFAAGGAAATAAISVKVVALIEGVLKTMCFAKVKSVVILLVVAVLGSATGLMYRTQAADQPSKKLQASITPTTENERNDDDEGKRTTKEARADSGKAGELHDVQVRITGPLGMKVVLTGAGQGNRPDPIEAPGRLNLERGKNHRLKLTHIPNRPRTEVFPTVEIPTLTETTEPFVTSSAISIEFTEEDFDQVRDGNAITKVVYLPAGREGKSATIASYNLEPGRDVIAETRRRGAILAVVRMGNIDLDTDKPVKVEIGDDGIQGRILQRDENAKAEGKNSHADRLAIQLDHLLRDVGKMQAENEALRRRLKKAELEIQSLRDLLERRKR